MLIRYGESVHCHRLRCLMPSWVSVTVERRYDETIAKQNYLRAPAAAADPSSMDDLMEGGLHE